MGLDVVFAEHSSTPEHSSLISSEMAGEEETNPPPPFNQPTTESASAGEMERHPAVSARAQETDVSGGSRKEYRLGVLFVHGIGRPRLGETMTRWGDALIRVIGLATKHTVAVTVDKAHTGSRRAEAKLVLQNDGQRERWLLKECWWAQSFPPPTYGELVSWSLWALPWSLSLHGK